jgi:hypothetical protein
MQNDMISERERIRLKKMQAMAQRKDDSDNDKEEEEKRGRSKSPKRQPSGSPSSTRLDIISTHSFINCPKAPLLQGVTTAKVQSPKRNPQAVVQTQGERDTTGMLYMQHGNILKFFQVKVQKESDTIPVVQRDVAMMIVQRDVTVMIVQRKEDVIQKEEAAEIQEEETAVALLQDQNEERTILTVTLIEVLKRGEVNSFHKLLAPTSTCYICHSFIFILFDYVLCDCN